MAYPALALLLSALTVGCASHAAPPAASAADASASRYVLLPSEIERARADNVYDAIAKLRPEFLRAHGEQTEFVNQGSIGGGARDPGLGVTSKTGIAVAAGAPGVVAYHDNARLGSVDDLKLLQLSNVAEIRYIPGPQAGVKYGSNHSGGVILVTSK